MTFTELEIDKIVCAFSIRYGTSFTPEQLDGLVAYLTKELNELLTRKQTTPATDEVTQVI